MALLCHIFCVLLQLAQLEGLLAVFCSMRVNNGQEGQIIAIHGSRMTAKELV